MTRDDDVAAQERFGLVERWGSDQLGMFSQLGLTPP